jgi:hypothetical protein
LTIVVNDHVPFVTEVPLAVTVAVYVLAQSSAAVGVKVTTPVDAFRLDVPGTAAPAKVSAIDAVTAFERVEEITTVAGLTFVTAEAGVLAVDAALGNVLNDQVPPLSAAPFAVAVME